MRAAVVIGILCSVSLMSGCAVRTYTTDRDRVDQDLQMGNRGFLMGKAPAVGPRKTQRSTRVVEIELGGPVKVARQDQSAPSTGSSAQFSSGMTEPSSAVYSRNEEMSEPGSFDSYTVAKGDTLQKISQKFYGTTKKWKKLFNANTDILKTPDHLRPGQILKIPVLAQSAMAQPTENLK